MKTKFLMLALIAILFSACSVDQDETNFENANVELSESNEFTEANSDDSRNGFSSRNSLAGCRASGLVSVHIIYIGGNGTTPFDIWKEQVRARFISYGFARHGEENDIRERWDFILDNMSEEKAALSEDGCKNDVVRTAIEDDDDVEIDQDKVLVLGLGGI